MFFRDLSDNDFDHLPIPKYGWPELHYLYLKNVPSLYQAPGPSDCPKLQAAVFTYAYHCCAFESFLPPNWHEPSSPYEGPIIVLPSRIEDIEEITATPDLKEANHSHICEFWKQFNITTFCTINELADEMAEPSSESPQINLTEIKIIRRLTVANIPPNNSFVCYPKADPLTPCENLLGSWALRILVWIVFVVILFSNGLILTMIMASFKPFRRCGSETANSKVSQFYISQLIVADIGICIYLGFLIVVDLKTFNKQEFYQMVLSWQYGPGCLTAGFIAIFSSELSVYMLVIIVLERIYAYRFTGTPTKMHAYSTALIIPLGWIFASACATLPLVGINSYKTVAICLPFDVTSTEGRFYIAILMGINLLAFINMIICNFYLCCKLRKIIISDSKMLCVMFILIVIDFICWAPLIVFSLAALSKHSLIDTSTAKWFTVLVLPITACVNPFLYGPLLEKFRHQMQKICHNALPLSQHCTQSGSITPQHECNRIICHHQTTLGQNSPGVLSSNASLVDHHTSLPELRSNGSFLPIPLSSSMPDLANSNEVRKMTTKSTAVQTTVKAQATDKQLETKVDVDTNEEQTKRKDFNEGTIITLDNVSSKMHHSSDESSGIDSPSVNPGTVYSVHGIDEDLQSITSLSDKAAGTFNSDQHMINVISCKLNSPAVIEETDV